MLTRDLFAVANLLLECSYKKAVHPQEMTTECFQAGDNYGGGKLKSIAVHRSNYALRRCTVTNHHCCSGNLWYNRSLSSYS